MNLYQLYLKPFFKNIFLKLFYIEEEIEIGQLFDRFCSFDEYNSTIHNVEKIVFTKDIKNENIQIYTDTGFKNLSHLHLTKKFQKWEIITSGLKQLICADEHIVFKSDYKECFIKDLSIGDEILTSNGIETIIYINKLQDEENMFDVTVDDCNHRFYTNGILSHNSVTSSLYIVHYLIFNSDKGVAFVANKDETAVEILDKAAQIMKRLPFFLKPGILGMNSHTILFDNDNKLRCCATTGTASIGFTINFLFMDEFAHVPSNILDSFYENIYPTLSADPNSRIIISSTAGKFNKFKDIWDDAENGKNSYKPFRIDWWEVPGRDEKWRQKEILNLGSESAFNRQYGNMFDGGGKTLLDGDIISNLYKNKIVYEWKPIDAVGEVINDYTNLKWRPDIDPYDLRNAYIFTSVDIGEGTGSDYSVINIFRLEFKTESEIKKIKNTSVLKNYFKLVQVGMYHDNYTTLSNLVKIFVALSVNHFNQEKLVHVIEYNTYGSEFIYRAKMENEKFDYETIQSYKHSESAKIKKHGLRINSQIKPILAGNLLTAISQDLSMSINESRTAFELSQYGRNKKGNYCGFGKNDDCAASTVNMASIFETNRWEEYCEEFFETLPVEQQNLFFENQNKKINKIIDDYLDMSELINISAGNMYDNLAENIL